MQNAVIDNSIDTSKSILWQYDKATNLIALVYLFWKMGLYTTIQFWERFVGSESSIDTATDFGLSIWGALLGQPWITYKKNGETIRISSSLYRKVLKGKAYLISSNGSLASINKYLSIVFSGRIIVSDGYDMSITYRARGTLSEEENAVKKKLFIYPAGVRSNNINVDPGDYIGLNKFNKYTDESGAEVVPTEQNLCNLCDSQDSENPNKGILYASAYIPPKPPPPPAITKYQIVTSGDLSGDGVFPSRYYPVYPKKDSASIGEIVVFEKKEQPYCDYSNYIGWPITNIYYGISYYDDAGEPQAVQVGLTDVKGDEFSLESFSVTIPDNVSHGIFNGRPDYMQYLYTGGGARLYFSLVSKDGESNYTWKLNGTEGNVPVTSYWSWWEGRVSASLHVGDVISTKFSNTTPMINPPSQYEISFSDKWNKSTTEEGDVYTADVSTTGKVSIYDIDNNYIGYINKISFESKMRVGIQANGLPDVSFWAERDGGTYYSYFLGQGTVFKVCNASDGKITCTGRMIQGGLSNPEWFYTPLSEGRFVIESMGLAGIWMGVAEKTANEASITATFSVEGDSDYSASHPTTYTCSAGKKMIGYYEICIPITEQELSPITNEIHMTETNTKFIPCELEPESIVPYVTNMTDFGMSRSGYSLTRGWVPHKKGMPETICMYVFLPKFAD